jgi:phosphatidate cytidylyltransferase
MNLLKRVIVAVIFIPVLLAVFYIGKIPLLVFLTLLSVGTMWEMRSMLKLKQIVLPFVLIPVSGLLFLAASILPLAYLYFFLILIFLGIFSRDVFSGNLDGSIARGSISFFAVIYTALFPAAMFMLSKLPTGSHLLLLILIACWITDTFAYFVGMSLGKHRGLFAVSPYKSLEGFLGGFLFCVILLALYGYLNPSVFSYAQLLAAALAAGIFGQLGDLMESLFKRDVATKDSSHLIPGHGGLLDRFDSLLVAAPVFYFLLTVISNLP